MRVMLLPVAGEWCAVDVTDVREVVDDVAVEPLVTAPAAVAGLFNLRGEVVPLFDTGRLLGLAPTTSTDPILVVEVDCHPAGLTLDGRPTIAELGALLGATELRGARGVYEITTTAAAADAAVLLDVESLFGAGARS